MIIVYDSVTGVGKQFAIAGLSDTNQEKLEEPCILCT